MQLIGTIEKNSEEEIRIGWNSYNGTEYLDLRIFYRAEGDEMKPTKRGVTVRPEQAPELLELIERAVNEYRGGKSHE